jgi:hypothetical protein
MVEVNKEIFVSYRRDDTAAYAGWLADRVGDHFGKQNVFRDIGSIEPGTDFVVAIKRALESCAAMLVVIGRNWAAALKEHEQTGQEDYTRVEVATALKRNVRVIPVLVHGALMPRAEELPDDLAALRHRQAIELHDPNWESDVEHLIAQLEKIIGSGEEGTRSSESLAQRTPRDVAQGTIRVVRDDTFYPYCIKDPFGREPPIWLSVDGEDKGKLSNLQQIDLKLDTGRHTLEVRGLKMEARLVPFNLPRLDEARVSVRVHSGDVNVVLCGIAGTWWSWGPFIKGS